MSTASKTVSRTHNAAALNQKWDTIWHELRAESETADSRCDPANPSNFQIKRFAWCLRKLFDATGRMPMLAHRLSDAPETFADYQRGLERIRRSLRHVSLDRLISDRSYAKQKNAQLARTKTAINKLCPRVCQTGDDLQWISIVLD